MIKTCPSSQTRAKWYAKNSKSSLSTITRNKHLLLLLEKKKDVFVNHPTGFGKSFIHSSTLIGYSYNGNGMPSSVEQTFVGEGGWERHKKRLQGGY